MRAMRIPLEYGDNFPVPTTGSWDPTVPWRFPKHKVELKRPSTLSRLLPWLMLGLGVTLGVLLVSWRLTPVSSEEWKAVVPLSSGEKAPVLIPGESSPSSVIPDSAVPRPKPAKRKSRVA